MVEEVQVLRAVTLGEVVGVQQAMRDQRHFVRPFRRAMAHVRLKGEVGAQVLRVLGSRIYTDRTRRRHPVEEGEVAWTVLVRAVLEMEVEEGAPAELQRVEEMLN